jgi:hypothetical protein
MCSEHLHHLFIAVPNLPIFRVPRLSIKNKSGILPARTNVVSAVGGFNAIAFKLAVATIHQERHSEMLKMVDGHSFTTLFEYLSSISVADAMKAEDVVRRYPLWNVDASYGLEFIREHPSLEDTVHDTYWYSGEPATLRDRLSSINGIGCSANTDSRISDRRCLIG